MDRKPKSRKGIIITAGVGVAVALGILCYFFVLPLFNGKEKVLTGFQTIDGVHYYYAENGTPETGLRDVDGKLYYFAPPLGRATIGWFTAPEGDVYYFGADGVAVTGAQDIDGKPYEFDSEGRLVLKEEPAGYVWETKDGKMYCKGPDGEYITGLAAVDEVLYYFAEDGARQSGWQEIEGKKYYFSPANGRAAKGWFDEKGASYYFGEDSAAYTGKQSIAGKEYTFGSDGKLVIEATKPVGVKPGSSPSSSGVAVVPPVVAPPVVVPPAPTPVGMRWDTDAAGNKKCYNEATGQYLTGRNNVNGNWHLFDASGVMQTGWSETEGKKAFYDAATGYALVTTWKQGAGDAKSMYYLGSDGFAVTGLQPVGTDMFGFAEDGAQLKNLQILDGLLYCFTGDNGKAITGWYPEDPAVAALRRTFAAETYYYFGGSYSALTGVNNIDSKYYNFNKGGLLRKGWADLDGKIYNFGGLGGEALLGWQKNEDKQHYMGPEGYALAGVVTDNGAYYYFGTEYTQETGWRTVNGTAYCFEGEAGAALVSQWKNNGDGWYYLGDKGAGLTGLQTLGEGEDKALYYFDSMGVRTAGWQNVDGKLYLLAEDGKAQYGWQEKDGGRYYIGAEGHALTGLQTVKNADTQADEIVYLGTAGAQLTGWQQVNGKRYLFDSASGSAVIGQYVDGANVYHFAADGAALTGLQVLGEGDDKALYYFDVVSAVRKSGWQTVGKLLYYFKADTAKAHIGWYTDIATSGIFYFGAEGAALTGGPHVLEEIKYQFDANGRLKPDGDGESAWVTTDGSTYFVGADGNFVTGLKTIAGSLYYFNNEGARQSGFMMLNNKNYRFDDVTGKAMPGFYKHTDDNTYYFGDEGHALTGLQIIRVASGAARKQVSAFGLNTADTKEALFYFGTTGIMLTGEQSVAGKLYFFDASKDGAAAVGWYPSEETATARYYGDAYYALTGMQTIGTDLYMFADNGVRNTGWQTVQNRRYFFSQSGKAVKGEFAADDGNYYYFAAEGYALVGKQTLGEGENAGVYYFDAQGVRQHKWQTIGGKRYYFSPADGKAEQGRFADAENGNSVYYFAPEGYVLVGVHLMADGYTRTFDIDGKMTSEKATVSHHWVEYEGLWYYEDSTGAGSRYKGMCLIDEAWYYFDVNTGARSSGAILAEKDGVEKLYYFSGDDGKALRGWYTNAENDTYYLDPDEYYAWIGAHIIGTISYEFDETGKLMAGFEAPIFNDWRKTDGKVYYLDSSGEPVKGLYLVGGVQYYFGTDGVRVGGKHTIDDGAYYFEGKNEQGEVDNRALVGWNLVEQQAEAPEGTTWRWVCLAAKTGRQETGWVYRAGSAPEGGVDSYFFHEDGSSPSGFVVLNSARRFFFPDGKMAVGLQTITTDAGTHQYYFYTASGVMAVGVVDVEGTPYSFDADGRVALGWNNDDAGYRYYFTADGAMKGWQKFAGGDGAAEKWHHFDEATGRQLLSWQTRVDGEASYRHFFFEDGTSPEGFGEVNSVYRYFYPEGYMATGWQTIERTPEGGQPEALVYYFHSTGEMARGDTLLGSIKYAIGSDGVVPQGWQIFEGKRYYYTPTGALTGWQDELEGRTVYFNATDGYQMTGMQKRESPAGLYYYNEDGSSPAGEWITPAGKNYKIYVYGTALVAVGWQTVEEIPRYFHTDGRMATGVVVIDGKTHSFDENGAQIMGWNVGADGKRYYFTVDDAAKGWQQIEENAVSRWYLFDNETGAQLLGWQTRTVDKKALSYYYFTNGTLPDAGWNSSVESATRYFMPDGQAAQGWQTLATGRHFFNDAAKGVPSVGWFMVDQRWYVTAGDVGVQLLGWQSREVAVGITGYYYYAANGELPATGWTASIDGKVRYVTAEGKMASGWQTIASFSYYFTPEGAFYTGENVINGATYVFDAQGRYVAPPAITGVTFNNQTWETTKTVAVQAAASALLPNKTLMYSFDSGATWIAASSKAFAPGSVIAANTLRVKDSLGNITSYGTAITLTNPFSRMKGVDVSDHQGYIDWAAVKASGIDFAIIRSLTWRNGYYAIDKTFDYNVRQAKAHGLKVGTYLFTYAFNNTEMKEEIDFFMNSPEIRGLMADKIYFDMPVYIDYEYSELLVETPYHLRAEVIRFGMVLIEQQSKKLFGQLMLPGFYMNLEWARKHVDAASLVNDGYEFWLAHWDVSAHGWKGKAPSMWQYTVAPPRTVPGISTDIDMDYCYKDYSAILSGGVTPAPITGRTITVYDQNSKQTVSGPAASILAQIVMNEVGGFSNAEVFKAQAVAAQSWILYQNSQGFMTPSVGLKSPTTAVQNAVNEVVKQNLVYGGRQAFTPYYAYSAGSTNDNTYWGNGLAYLKSVASGNDRNRAAFTMSVSEDAMKKRLQEVYNTTITDGKDPSTWIQITGSNAAGYATRLNVCGRTPTVDYFYQTIVPSVNGARPIRSPHFTVTYDASSRMFTFTSRGWGHGVGMSQQGANDMAVAGSNYAQILAHYFPGTTIGNLY